MITYIFTPANIRLSFENAKRFLEYFLKLPQISQINTDSSSLQATGILILPLCKKSEGVKDL